MKLILCSEGFYDQSSVQACEELCGKPREEISVAIINEAFAVEEGDKRWVLDNLNSVPENFGGDIDIIDLLALPLAEIENRIQSKDLMFVIGGNTDYLMHVFDKTGFAQLLPKLLETKVYVGSSAGSMVVGRRVSTEAYIKMYGEPGYWGVDEYLGLVNVAIKPHMNSDIFPNNKPEILEEVAHGADFPVYGLTDKTALIVVDSERLFVGENPYIVGRA